MDKPSLQAFLDAPDHAITEANTAEDVATDLRMDHDVESLPHGGYLIVRHAVSKLVQASMSLRHLRGILQEGE